MVTANIIDEMTCQFQVDKTIASETFSIESAESASFSPLAKKLFGFPWVDRLVIKPSSVELTKKDWVDWDIIVEPLTGLLDEYFAKMTAPEKPLPTKAAVASSESEQIQAYIESQINPALAMHGGFVELKSFENHVAYLSMGGGCQGCASSQATMADGIENALKNQFPFVHHVVDVTNHALGNNPFYS